MNETGRYYIKGNKADTERQILHGSHFYVESKIVKLTEAESRMVVARGEGEREMGDVGQMVQFQLCKMNEFWRPNIFLTFKLQ